jgi:hypothetical protein
MYYWYTVQSSPARLCSLSHTGPAFKRTVASTFRQTPLVPQSRSSEAANRAGAAKRRGAGGDRKDSTLLASQRLHHDGRPESSRYF